MLDIVHAFFDELRVPIQTTWPNVPSAPPGFMARLRADHVTHGRAGNENLDQVEAALVMLYEAGSENAEAQALFDHALAIIKKTSIPAIDRFQQICKTMIEAGSKDAGQ